MLCLISLEFLSLCIPLTIINENFHIFEVGISCQNYSQYILMPLKIFKYAKQISIIKLNKNMSF